MGKQTRTTSSFDARNSGCMVTVWMSSSKKPEGGKLIVFEQEIVENLPWNTAFIFRAVFMNLDGFLHKM